MFNLDSFLKLVLKCSRNEAFVLLKNRECKHYNMIRRHVLYVDKQTGKGNP